MPYKSDAQRRKFHAMEAKGEISPATVREYDKKSKGKKLPERVTIKDAAGGVLSVSQPPPAQVDPNKTIEANLGLGTKPLAQLKKGGVVTEHKMPDGHMMKDSDMPAMKKHKGSSGSMLRAGMDKMYAARK